MKQHSKQWLVSLAASAALAAGVAGTAQAQDNPQGGMPQVQQQGDVSFVSGGVGLDESHALRSAAHSWPLALRFTGPGSDYLADVHVTITNGHGDQVLQADARGPYMLVRLHPGHYTVHARYKDNDQSRSVNIGGKGHANAAFHWNEQ